MLAQVLGFQGLGPAESAIQRRIATTSILALARVQRDPSLSPTLALALSDRLRRLGTQLGHTFIVDLTQRMNGDVSVESVEGEGTRVMLRFTSPSVFYTSRG